MEIRTRYRAVTAEDFEFLCRRGLARASPADDLPAAGDADDAIRVHILLPGRAGRPAAQLEELTPDDELLSEVAAYLDGRRVIGTTVHLLPVRLRGVSVVVNLQAEPQADPPARRGGGRCRRLYTYLNPLVGGSPTGPGTAGRSAARSTRASSTRSSTLSTACEFVKILRVYETDLLTGQQAPQPAGTHIALEADELIASGTHVVRAVHPEVA